MLLARGTNLHDVEPFPAQGLWWIHAKGPSGDRAAWSSPKRILDTDTPGLRPGWDAECVGPALPPPKTAQCTCSSPVPTEPGHGGANPYAASSQDGDRRCQRRTTSPLAAGCCDHALPRPPARQRQVPGEGSACGMLAPESSLWTCGGAAATERRKNPAIQQTKSQEWTLWNSGDVAMASVTFGYT